MGIEIELRFAQPLNAELPIDVTLLGILIEVRLVQPLNALMPIETTSNVLPLYVTVAGITISPEYELYDVVS